MKVQKLILALAIPLALIVSSEAIAHGGGLNAEGCHTNHKTGDYHCHRSPSSSSTSKQSSVNISPSTTYYRNCTEARAAGVTPILRGEPGYAPHLDRDNDGIACESYHGR